MNAAENRPGLEIGRPRGLRGIRGAPCVSGMEMSWAFLSRNLLFVAVAPLDTAQGFIHHSPGNLSTRHKVFRFSNQKAQITVELAQAVGSYIIQTLSVMALE